MDRIILHCDFNNFFASVACLDDESLKGKPVAVCGSTEQRHGIVLAKNELAKSCGVKTGEAIWQAKIKCPDMVTVAPDFNRYMHFSKLAREIFLDFTDRVEAFSIDESWLDVTGSTRLFGSGKKIADTLRQKIKENLGLTVSVGVSFNKVFAKIGSDYKKPDATTVITRENFKNMLWGLPACAMLGVGPNTEKRLNSLGIFTIGDIAGTSPDVLSSKLYKPGLSLWNYANGNDVSPVLSSETVVPPKSIGRSVTCSHDIEDFAELHELLLLLSEDVTARLRKWGFTANGVQVSLRTFDLENSSYQCTLPHSTAITQVIEQAGINLIKENGGIKKPLRSAGIRVFGLTAGNDYQISMLDNIEKQKKLEKIETSIDNIRNRFGSGSICRAVFLKKQGAAAEFSAAEHHTFKALP